MKIEITDWKLVRSTRKDSFSTFSKAPDDTIMQDGLTSEDACDDFLPGILDSITCAHIVPKLSWTDTYLLSSVNRTWLHGNRSRRFSYPLTDTLIVIPYFGPEVDVATKKTSLTISVALYSMKEDRYYELPQLPPFATPSPDLGFKGYYWYRIIPLDGKVYVIEVSRVFSYGDLEIQRNASRMLVFDVAGQGGWQQCANMQRTDDPLACGVIDNKIYVFGGRFRYKNSDMNNIVTAESEVYNPKDNTWSWITPLKYTRSTHKAGLLPGKLALRGDGKGCPLSENTKLECGDPSQENWTLVKSYDQTREEWTLVEISLSVVVGCARYRWFGDWYDHVVWGITGEGYGVAAYVAWRNFNVTDNIRRPKTMFTAHGKMYFMDDSSIYVYASEKRSWKYLHASSFIGMGMEPLDSFSVHPKEVLVVDKELLAIVEFWEKPFTETAKTLLLRSSGQLGGENKEIVWQRVRTDFLSDLGRMGWEDYPFQSPGTYISAIYIWVKRRSTSVKIHRDYLQRSELVAFFLCRLVI